MMFSDHQNWPLWMGMLSHAHSVHCRQMVAVTRSQIKNPYSSEFFHSKRFKAFQSVSKRFKAFQSISKAFKAIQRFFRCINFYFYAPPYTFQLPYTFP